MATHRQFVDGFDKIVQNQTVSMALKLAKGQCGNMESYHRQVGQIEGLNNAASLLRDMLGQVESAEDGDGLPEMTAPLITTPAPRGRGKGANAK